MRFAGSVVTIGSHVGAAQDVAVGGIDDSVLKLIQVVSYRDQTVEGIVAVVVFKLLPVWNGGTWRTSFGV